MNELEKLRQKYREATTDKERAAIVIAAKILKGELYQCYFEENGTRCSNKQVEMWCSDKHRIAWQEANYKGKRPHEGRRPSVQEMREKLSKMAIEAKLRAHTNKDGQTKLDV